MTPLEMIDALRRGPFAGYGGAKALAAEIGVSPLTIKLWRRPVREPSYASRQKVATVYKRHFGGDPA